MLGLCGGALFNHFNMPLAWMLGSMSACGLAAVFGLPVIMPPRIRPPMTMIIGTMLGTSFTTDILTGAASWWLPLLGLVAFLFVSGSLCSVYFRRVAGFDKPTAYFAGMPGGLMEMVTLGGERGGDDRMIALIHGSRIFLVVLCLPLLIEFSTGEEISAMPGAWRPWSVLEAIDLFWLFVAGVTGVLLGRWLRLPAYVLIGPMLVSAALHLTGLSDFTLPSMAVAAAQIAIGCIVGCRFAGTAPKLMARIMAISIGATFLLLSITFVFAEIVSWLSGISLQGVLLAYSPGGLAEMSLAALALGVEVPFVVLHHVVRVFLVVSGSVIFFRATSDR
ncbi:AbrB family transcriptional regulator [Limoniibacter endophyticus]|nr:AbrB family transcriptional regulator [Limoniibacter endophyticus]